MNAEMTDVVVLGAGPAGYVCAIRLAQLGRRVTIVDEGEVGGVCLNRGCIPSKALIHAGSTYRHLKNPDALAALGIQMTGSASMDLKKLIGWKNGVVQKLTGGVAALLKANGCQSVRGRAQFVDPHTVSVKAVDGKTLHYRFDHVVIATGSRPAKLPGLDVDQKQVLDSTGALSLEEIPKNLLCIGGGYIGLELGTFYAKIGANVTIVEAASGLLSGVDQELTQVVAKKLTALGVKILQKTLVKRMEPTSSGVEVLLMDQGKETRLLFDKVFVTIGRTPNSDALGLEKLGLETDAKGFIAVNAQRQTAIPHVYAIGDIAGQPLLAHKGSKEGIVAAEAIAGQPSVYDYQAVPAVVFTDPEIAVVGLTQAEAEAQGRKIKVGRFPFVANGRALSLGESQGFTKVISDAQTGRLLGVHIVGAEASSLISEAVLAIEMGAQTEDLAFTMHPHPTLSETLMEGAEAAMGHAIHIFQPRS